MTLVALSVDHVVELLGANTNASGDVNGVGIEVILKTFEDKRMLDFCTPSYS